MSKTFLFLIVFLSEGNELFQCREVDLLKAERAKLSYLTAVVHDSKAPKAP